MTFPAVQTTAKTAPNFSTVVAANLPSGITSGDLLILVIGSSYAAPGTFSATGWTFLSTDLNGTVGITLGYRFADGTEGSTVTVNWTNGCYVGIAAYRISSASTSKAPAKGTASTGASSAPDPPSLDPGWGAVDILWIAGSGQSSGFSILSAPTNYTNFVYDTTGTALFDAATRQLNASSEDPGTFGFSANPSAWVAQTFAVSPASTVWTGAASFSGDSAVAVDASVLHVYQGAATVTGAGDFKAVATHTPTGSHRSTGAGALAAQATHTPSAAVRFSGAGAVVAATQQTVSGVAFLSAAGGLASDATVKGLQQGSALLGGAGAFKAAASHTTAGAALTAGAGSLKAAASHAPIGAAAFAASGQFRAAVTHTVQGAARFAGAADVEAAAAEQAQVSQIHYRFRTDADAVDSAPTWAAGEDLNYSPPTLTPFRVRFGVQNTSDANTGAKDWQLMMSLNGGGYAAVDTTTLASLGVRAIDAGASADQAAINTQRL